MYKSMVNLYCAYEKHRQVVHNQHYTVAVYYKKSKELHNAIGTNHCILTLIINLLWSQLTLWFLLAVSVRAAVSQPLCQHQDNSSVTRVGTHPAHEVEYPVLSAWKSHWHSIWSNWHSIWLHWHSLWWHWHSIWSNWHSLWWHWHSIQYMMTLIQYMITLTQFMITLTHLLQVMVEWPVSYNWHKLHHCSIWDTLVNEQIYTLLSLTPLPNDISVAFWNFVQSSFLWAEKKDKQ